MNGYKDKRSDWANTDAKISDKTDPDPKEWYLFISEAFGAI